MKVLQWLCLISAFIALVVGASSLSQATMGAGLIAAACFWAILARIAQAAVHDGKMRNRLEQMYRKMEEIAEEIDDAAEEASGRTSPSTSPMNQADREREVARIMTEEQRQL